MSRYVRGSRPQTLLTFHNQYIASEENRGGRAPAQGPYGLRLLLVEALQVLAQQILAVVVAVRRAHDRVAVEFLRLGVVDEHAAMVVELDADHRALHLVIERAHIVGPADP